jgi:hypothetical protein
LYFTLRDGFLTHFLKICLKVRSSAGTVQSMHMGSYKRKTMDDNQKKFIPQLAIDTEFFHSAFVNPCMSERCALYCAFAH